MTHEAGPVSKAGPTASLSTRQKAGAAPHPFTASQ
jgi:hypothetical protein